MFISILIFCLLAAMPCLRQGCAAASRTESKSGVSIEEHLDNAGADRSERKGTLATPTGLVDVMDHLTKEGVEFEVEEARSAVSAGFSFADGMIVLRIDVNEDDDSIQVLAFLPIRVPEEKRPAASEFLNQVNYGLRLGNLEMDRNDGEVNVRASAPYPTGDLSEETIRKLIQCCLYEAREILPVLKLLKGNPSEESTKPDPNFDHQPTEAGSGVMALQDTPSVMDRL